MKKILAFLCAMFFVIPVFACTNNEIDVLGDGTNCQTAHFTLTTTSTNSFQFMLSARGTFYVDCGNGGNLQGTGASGKTITRSDTTEETYTCTWSSGAVQTIRFGGSATGYSTTTETAAIKFNLSKDVTGEENARKVAAASGSLGAIFPTLGQQNGYQPRFYRTFAGTLIATIPEELFLGISGATSSMFYQTFRGCYIITTIPTTLFSGVYGNANRMFASTFSGCSGLTSVPEGLFSGISVAAQYAFMGTFKNCQRLTSIPSRLFSGIRGSAPYMFESTFNGCTGLTTIPSGLFSGVSGAADYLFANTFYGCTNLSGYIPPSTFAGLIANNSPTATDMWSNTFLNTKLATTCPSGTTEYDSGYQTDWGRVSCYVDTSQTCDTGQYLPKLYNSCADCSMNSYCIGGTYNFNETTDQGIQSCTSGTFAPTGSAVCYPHILHVGNDVVYLRSTKQTTPSLNFRIGNDIFYANMTTVRTRMSKDSTHYFHAKTADNVHYYICDDTTCPQ